MDNEKTPTQGALDRITSWTRNSISLKLAGIGLLLLVMLIPLEQVREVIYDRENYQEQVYREISNDWAGQQTLSGPYLVVPFDEIKTITSEKTGETTTTKVKRTVTFLPEELDIDAQLMPEIRHRGIYNVSVYKSDIAVQGKFGKLDFNLPYDSIQVHLDRASVVMGISDLRGVQDQLYMDSNIGRLSFQPGTASSEAVGSGVEVPLDLSKGMNDLTFDINVGLKGSYSLNVLPLGKTTTTSIRGKWASPSFNGSFLPDTSHIDEIAGEFEGKWKVLDLNRSFPQRFFKLDQSLGSYGFGVNLYMPVNEYQKTMRSVKYAVLFMALTFICFFFVQILKKIRIHFIQYLLVGFALCLFYLLLLSLSEQIGFGWAYLVATSAIILQIVLYVRAITKNNVISAWMAGLLVVLYGFVYSIIQMEEKSLLFGSIGLFLILGAVMYLSRKIEWGKPSESIES